jgi:aromatic ring-opening dioxygenase catalytic subunit (LigB family)
MPDRSVPARQPALFLSHGGGPCFWMDYPEPVGRHGFDGLRRYLENLMPSLPEQPRAWMIVSAHWEAATPTVGAQSVPSMLYDYYGFPPNTYQLQWPARGAHDVAARVRALLAQAGIPSDQDDSRGYDHGVFVPFLIADPEASTPVATLSLRSDLDPGFHLAVGRALAPLRDEGVAIIGSGMSYHNLRRFLDGDGRASVPFDDWLTAAATADPDARDRALTRWMDAPNARECHPRAEHLLPLMVVAGAAGADRGRRDFHDRIGDKAVSGYRFG